MFQVPNQLEWAAMQRSHFPIQNQIQSVLGKCDRERASERGYFLSPHLYSDLVVG